jgi:predicted component of type VI protein secretion system
MSRRFTIGRERSCDVAIADDSVSRVHAEIWLNDDGSLMVADRGSSNGTILIRSGQVLSKLTTASNAIVMPADQVRFGNVTLSVADLIAAVESRHAGALTPASARRGPPPLPPPPPHLSRPAAPPRAGAALIRCECGAIKTFGQTCPGCHQ